MLAFEMASIPLVVHVQKVAIEGGHVVARLVNIEGGHVVARLSPFCKPVRSFFKKRYSNHFKPPHGYHMRSESVVCPKNKPAFNTASGSRIQLGVVLEAGLFESKIRIRYACVHLGGVTKEISSSH
jgi:hypothetical protein